MYSSQGATAWVVAALSTLFDLLESIETWLFPASD